MLYTVHYASDYTIPRVLFSIYPWVIKTNITPAYIWKATRDDVLCVAVESVWVMKQKILVL